MKGPSFIKLFTPDSLTHNAQHERKTTASSQNLHQVPSVSWRVHFEFKLKRVLGIGSSVSAWATDYMMRLPLTAHPIKIQNDFNNATNSVAYTNSRN